MALFIERFLGYVLVCVGLLCIVFAVFSMHSVFTDARTPPEIFKLERLSFSATPSGAAQPTKMDIPINVDTRKIVNMGLYYLLMLFMVIVGGRVSSLGVQFIKEVKVKMKT